MSRKLFYAISTVIIATDFVAATAILSIGLRPIVSAAIVVAIITSIDIAAVLLCSRQYGYNYAKPN